MATDDSTTTEELYIRFTERVETPVHISPETWDRIAAFAAEMLEDNPEKDPELAFSDAYHEFVGESPTVIVDGEVKTAADIPGADVDTDAPALDRERVHIRARAEYRPDEEIPLHITLDPPERVLDEVGGWGQLTETARIRRETDDRR